MNKRQRKKNKIVEFTEFGFTVSGATTEDTDNDAFMNAVIAAAESEDFMAGGGVGDGTFEFFISKEKGVKEIDRDVWDQFLMTCRYVTDYKVGTLVDMNR